MTTSTPLPIGLHRNPRGPGPIDLLRREAGGLACVLFLTLLVVGFYTSGPGWLQIGALLALLASSGAMVAGHLKGFDLAKSGAEAHHNLRLLDARQEIFLGTLLLITAHTFIQLAGPLGAEVYPLIYVLLVGMGTFQARQVSLTLVALAFFIEVACHLSGHPPGLASADWGALGLRSVFLGLFGGVYAGLLRLESTRHRRRTAAALDKSTRDRESASRDYRLVATGKPAGGSAPVAREDAEEMLREDAIGAIRASIDETLRLLRASLGCHSAVLLWLDEEGLRLKRLGADSASPQKLAGTLQPGEGVLAGILRRREVVRLGDLRPGYGGLGYYLSAVSVRQFLGAPVIERGHLRGVLCLDRTTSTPFGEGDAEVAQRATAAIVRAVQTERLFLAMEAARYELDRFYEASRQLNSALTPEQVHEVALACARDLCHFDFAAIVLTEEAQTGRRHEIVRVEGQPDWARALEGLSFGHNAGLVSLAVEMQVALPHSGVYKPRQNMVFTLGRQLEGMHSLLILPLMAHDQALGALVLACEAQGVFTTERREILGVVANQVAISLQNAHLYKAMEMMATTDGLTGLTNHRTFKARLDEVIARSQRGNAPFSILLTDIDHFKSVNDNYGHPVGDEVLRQVSAAFQRLLRQTDIPARYGGEEFIVILEGTDLDGALQIADRLRCEIEALTFRTPEREFSVTMSFGASEYPTDAETKATLIDSADQALYYAKTHGRNQVRAWRSVHRAPDFGQGKK